jgi:hypothetical protein
VGTLRYQRRNLRPGTIGDMSSDGPASLPRPSAPNLRMSAPTFERFVAWGALGGVTEIIRKSILSRLRPPTMVFTGESGSGLPSGPTTGFTTMVVAVAITIPTVVDLAGCAVV